jgi:hypothetical protein
MNFSLCNPVINGFPANLAEKACLNNRHQLNLHGALQTVIAFHGLVLTLVETRRYLKISPVWRLSYLYLWLPVGSLTCFANRVDLRL